MKGLTQIDSSADTASSCIEQQLEIGGGMALRGVAYELRELTGGATEVALETRYVSPRRPRWS